MKHTRTQTLASCLAIAAAIGMTGSLMAQTIWTNAAGGSWNDAVNWNPNAIPGAADYAIATLSTNTVVNYSQPMSAASILGLTVGSKVNINASGFTIDAMGGSPLTNKLNSSMVINADGVVTITNSLSPVMETSSTITVNGGRLLTTNNFGGFLMGANGNNAGIGFTNNGGTVVFDQRVTLKGRYSRFIMNGGSTDFIGGLGIDEGSNDMERQVLVNGGLVNLGALTIARTLTGPGAGLVISNGVVNATSMRIGTTASRGYATIYGGVLTNTGLFTICDRNNGATSGDRVVKFLVRGGTVVATSVDGIVVANQANTGAAASGVIGGVLDMNAGTLIAEKLTLILDNTFINAWATFNLSGGTIFLGSGGLVANSGSGGSGYFVNINGGTLAANADWSSAANMTLGTSKTVTVQAADAASVSHNISLSGIISGSNGGINKTGAGTLTLDGANTYSGNTLINQGTLALGAAGSISSSASILVGSNAVFDVGAVSGGYTLAPLKFLNGWGGIKGDILVASTSIVDPGTNNAPGTLTFSNSLTMTGGAKIHFDLSTNPSGPNNDLVVVNGDLNVSGISNVVEILGGGSEGSVHPLFKYNGAFNGDLASFALSGPSGWLTNDTTSTPKMIAFVSTSHVRGPTNIVWVGNATANDWDTLNITNWLNNGVLDYFVPKDDVLFGSAGAANPNVILSGSVMPNSVTVDAASDYTFGGTGSIEGVMSLIKTNTGRLTINTTNLFTGSVSIQGGTLSVASLADDSSPSPIGASGPVLVDGGTLDYSGSSFSWTRPITLGPSGGGVSVSDVASTLTSTVPMTGGGSLIKSGDGGLTLNAANSYSGGTIVNAGWLTIANVTGASAGTVTLNGGNLALGAVKPANTIIVAADGVISGGNAGGLTGIRNVTGSSNLTLAVTTGVFDLTGDMSAYGGTITLSNAGGAIVRLNGNTGSPLATWDLGTGAMDINVRSGSTSNNFGALKGGATTTLSGRSSSDNNGATTHHIGANGLSTTFEGVMQNGTYSAQILSITKVGTGTLTLAGANTYSGRTTIQDGVLALIDNGSIDYSTNINIASGKALDVSARVDGTLNLGMAAIQTLRGDGTVRGSLAVGGLGTLAPGSSIGTLTVTNTVTLYGSVIAEINRAGTPNADKLVAPTIALGGTLVVTNTGARLQVGDTFDLFDGTLSGSFSSIVLPSYYTWDTSQLEVNGTIRVTGVISGPSISSVDYSTLPSGIITFNATNGLANAPVYVLTSTNIGLPLTSWTNAASGTFDAEGNLTGLPVTVDPSEAQRFYLLQAF